MVGDESEIYLGGGVTMKISKSLIQPEKLTDSLR